MEIRGKIVQVMPLVSGMGKKGQWQKQEVILETQGQYPKKVAVAAWGDNIDKFDLTVGDDVTLSIELESREYNGRWYTEIRVWKSERHGISGPPPRQAPAPQHVSDGPKDDTDDLPF